MERLQHTLIIIVLLLAVAAPSFAQEPPTCASDYTVRAGDTLAEIAKRFYGDRTAYRSILEATNAEAEVDSSYTTIADPSLIEPGWKLCLPDTGGSAPQVSAEQQIPQDLLVTMLENAQYESQYTSSGQVTLTNGEYREQAAPGSATELVVRLTDWLAIGALNGQSVAAVILLTEPGGSGPFYDLAIVAERDLMPLNIASTALGDRVEINSLVIENNQVVVDMVMQGPNDPMCCPTLRVVDKYVLEADQLTRTSREVAGTVQPEQTAQPGSEMAPVTGGTETASIPFDFQGLASEVTRVAVSAQPYDDSLPTGPVGTPAHVEFLFDGEDRLRIYPVQEYAGLWESEGNRTVFNNITQLRTILANRPELPQGPLPALPPQPGYNDVAVQMLFLDFANGSGISFVGRFTENPAPVLDEQLKYFFQGLTNDNRYYVSFEYPVSTSALPDSVAPEQEAQIASEFYNYLQNVLDALSILRPEDFTPNLTRLDALVQSLAVPEMP